MQQQQLEKKRKLESSDTQIELNYVRAKYDALLLEFETSRKQATYEVSKETKKYLDLKKTFELYQAEAKHENERNKENIAQLTAKNQDLNKELSDFRQSCRVLEAKVTELRQAVESEEALGSHSKLQHDSKTQQLELKVRSLEDQLERQEESFRRASEAEIAVLKTECQVAKRDAENAHRLLDDATEAISDVKELRELRKENLLRESQERQLLREVKTLKESAKNTAIQEEKLLNLRMKLGKSEKQCAELMNVQANHDAGLKEKQEWLVEFSSIAASFPDLLELAKANSLQASLQLHKYMQEKQLSMLEQQGKLETRIKLLDIKIRESAKRELAETSRCAELDAKLSESQHQCDIVESKRLYLEKKVNTLLSFMETYDKETALNAPVDDVTKIKVEHLEESLRDAQGQISALQQQQAVSPSPAAFTKHKARVSVLEKELQSKSTEVATLTEELRKADMEISSLELSLGRGEFNPAKTRVVHMTQNPSSRLSDKELKVMEELRKENAELKRMMIDQQGSSLDVSTHSLHNDDSNTSQEAMDALKLRNQRLMEVFRNQFSKYQNAIQLLTGYTIALKTDPKKEGASIITLKSMYAEREEDEVKFMMNAAGSLDLLETDFCARLDNRLFTYLNTCHSIPAFISGITLHLFENVTFQG